LLVTNAQAADLTDIQYTFTCPGSLKLLFPNDGTHVADNTSAQGAKTKIKQLPHLTTSVLVSETQIGNWEFNLTTTVALSYSIDDRVQYARFQIPITATDFIRPHVIPIQQYGQNWKAFTRTVSYQIPTKTITPEVYKKMATEANFGVIDVKGFEIVSCARALPNIGNGIGGTGNSGQQELVLLYGKITQGQLTISLKALNQGVIDALGNALKVWFSNK